MFASDSYYTLRAQIKRLLKEGVLETFFKHHRYDEGRKYNSG